MAGFVEEIYLAPEGSAAMEQVHTARALAGCGFEGDRYCKGNGYWTPFGDVCEITLIEAEDIEDIEREAGLHVSNGEHRRNVITRGLRLGDLRRTTFRIGEAVLRYDRPRPPCKHIQEMTEPGMTRALRNRGGICARVVEPGTVKPGDQITPL